MATVNLQGTQFSFSILPVGLFSNGYWAKTEISLTNEYVHYRNVNADIARDELEDWIFAMYRLLAGAYATEYSLSFEKAGLIVDLCPHTVDGREVSREERQQNDCLMLLRFLMRSGDNKRFLDGVYTLVLHREEISKFADELRRSFDEIYARHVHGRGKYQFVGVSPLVFHGCNYWYLDTKKEANAGDYVWVTMGKHNREQIVLVDSVRLCNDDTAPYDPLRVKRILRKATEEETKDLL